MARHIFVDNSNVFGCMQAVKNRLEPDLGWGAMRLELQNLFDLVENNEKVGIRSFVGSDVPQNQSVFDKANDCGYDTYRLSRITFDDGSSGEQAVDEILHLLIANAIIDLPVPQTLVIVSGDGKDSNYGSSFVSQAERALRSGWKVEVWAWPDGMTSRYDYLLDLYPEMIIKNSLEPHYNSITYAVRGRGDYKLLDGSLASTRIRRPTAVDFKACEPPEAAGPDKR